VSEADLLSDNVVSMRSVSELWLDFEFPSEYVTDDVVIPSDEVVIGIS